MPVLEHAGGAIWYDVLDLVPPWIEAPPVILFHHGLGIDARIWNGWLPGLADRYRIVRLDMRGCGRSSAPGAGFPWSMDRLADDARAGAEAAGARQFHWVGESIGGTIGLHFATRYPQMLRTLTACSTSYRGASVQRVKEWRAFIGEHGMAAWSAMMMPHRLHRADVPEEAYRWFEQEQAAADLHVTLDLADLLIGADLAPLLPTIAQPALLLAPGESPFVPLEVMRELHRLLPDSELQIFPGVRHALAYSHGPACSRALRTFLARRVPSEAPAFWLRT